MEEREEIVEAEKSEEVVQRQYEYEKFVKIEERLARLEKMLERLRQQSEAQRRELATTSDVPSLLRHLDMERTAVESMLGDLEKSGKNTRDTIARLNEELDNEVSIFLEDISQKKSRFDEDIEKTEEKLEQITKNWIVIPFISCLIAISLLAFLFLLVVL